MLRNTMSPDLKFKFAVVAAAATMGAASVAAGMISDAKFQARESQNTTSLSVTRMPFPIQ